MRLYLYLLIIACCFPRGNTRAQQPGQTMPYTHHTEIGILSGSGNTLSQSVVFTFQTFNGLKLRNWLAAGITTGIDTYPEISILPLAAGARFMLPGPVVTPYCSLDTGYGTDWLEQENDELYYRGGWMIHPALGLHIMTGTRGSISLSLGFKHQRAARFEASPGFLQEDDYRFNRMSLQAGFSF